MIAIVIEIDHFSNTRYLSKLKILIIHQFQKRGTKAKVNMTLISNALGRKKKLAPVLNTQSSETVIITPGNIPCS